jgi:alanyl-tRNA synthetase
VRRIVAVTGTAAIELFQNQADLIFNMQRMLNCKEEELPNRISQLYQDKKSLEKKIKELKQSDDSDIIAWVNKASKVGDYIFVIELLSIEGADELKRVGDRLISEIKSGIGVLFNNANDKPSAVVVVSEDLVRKKINAGILAKEIGSFMGGGGGGKPQLATAGGRQFGAVEKAIINTEKLIVKVLNKEL